MHAVIIGSVGSDAGYWVWDGKGFHHVGGWGIEQLREVSAALNIMRQATQLKTPGLAEAAARVVSDFVGKQLETHLKDAGKGGPVVIVV